jgi:hypothetical protein
MMAQQQYYPVGMHGGPPSFDPNLAAAWEQLQFQQMQQQQQQHSPIIYHNSPTTGQQQQGQQQHLPPNLQYPYMYPYPPPPLHGSGGVGNQPQQFYPPPSFGYPMQPPLIKPPRTGSGNSNPNSRRGTPKQSDSKTFGGNSVPTSVAASSNKNAHAASSSGNLPDLSDIFSSGGGGGGGGAAQGNIPPGQSYLSPLVDNGAGGGPGSGGYGSLASGGGSATQPPKIYNAPSGSSSRRLPPSGRGPSLPRTDSSNDLKKRSAAALPKTNHRRTLSDNPLRTRHRRAGSFDALPPSGSSGGHSRSRTLSGGNPFVPKPSHRRANSASSMISTGDASQMSVRSNIAKSSLFGGVDPHTGDVMMHFPYEAIRLVMIPDKTKKKKKKKDRHKKSYQSIPYDDSDDEYSNLVIGRLYSDQPVNAAQYYEDYVQISDDLEQGATPQWESLETSPRHRTSGGGCGCQCANCNACIDKQDLLPPDNYVLPVCDDIYKRMLGEIAEARNMPCGLFYCGHHEDVSHPSIWIAGTIIILLFATMLYLSIYVECTDTDIWECLAS